MSMIRELRAKFTASAQGFSQSVKTITKDAVDMGNQTEKATKQADGGFQNLKSTIMGFAGAYLGFQALQGTLGGLYGVTNDYQTAVGHLGAKTGATADEMKGMEESLKNIYANNYGADFNDIADAMSNVQNNTGLTGKALETATQQAILLRDSMGYDVAESTKTADTMMKQFGITSEQAFTLMAQGQQDGLDKSGDMMDSFNEYSVYFKQLGFDAEGMWAVFKAGADGGAFNMDKVGDAIKEFGIRVKDQSKTTTDAFAGLGLNADKMAQDFAKGGETSQKALQTVFNELGKIEDPVKRNAIGVQLFGTQFEDLEHKTIMAMGNVRAQADMSGDTLANMDKIKYNNLGSALEGIKRMLIVEVLEPIQTNVMPVINQFINYIKQNMPQIKSAMQGAFSVIGEVFQTVGPILKDLWTILSNIAPLVAGPLYLAFLGIKDVLLPIIGFVTDITAKFTEWEGFEPLIIGIATALGVYNAKMILTKTYMFIVANATRMWAIAQGLLNVAMNLNPIGLIISLIAGLVAGLIYAYKNSETFRNIVNNAWASIKTVVAGVISWFATTIPIWIEGIKTWFTGLWTSITGIWNSIMSTITGVWNSIMAFVVPIVQAFVQAVVSKVQTLASGIMNFIQPLIDFFKNTWTNIKLVVLGIIGAFLNLITGNMEGFKISLLAIWTGIKNQVINIITTFKNMAINIFNVLKSGIVNTANGLKNGAIAVFNGLKSGAIAIWNGLKSAVVNSVSALKNGVVNGVTAVKNGVVNGFTNAKNTAINMFNAMRDGVKNAVERVKSTVTGMKDKVISTIKGINLKTIGKDIIQGLINGIGSKLTALKNKIKDVASAITGKIKSLLDINSPSRVMQKFGEWTGEGLGIGIQKMQKFVGQATEGLADVSIGALNEQTMNPMALDMTGTESAGGGGTNYNAPLMHVENQYVNDKTDGREIGITLYNRQRNADRKKGK